MNPFGFLVPVLFEKKGSVLSPEMKTVLSEQADWMRSNPQVSFDLTAYSGSPAQINLAKKRQTVIKNYFTDVEGISSDRFIFKMKSAASDKAGLIEIAATITED
jgi:outer membrane protein OmpA-like peptidoglycan-associated protein